jgi:hypothetical protein
MLYLIRDLMRFWSSVVLFLSVTALASFVALLFFDFLWFIFVFFLFFLSLFVSWSFFQFLLILFLAVVPISLSFHFWWTVWLALGIIRVILVGRLMLRLLLLFRASLLAFITSLFLHMLIMSLMLFLRMLLRVLSVTTLMSLFCRLLFRWIFSLICLFLKFFHGLKVFLLEVFAYLLDDVIEGSILVLVRVFFNVHVLYVLNKRILYFSRSIGINHHYKIPHQSFPVMKILRGLIINYPGIMKFTKPSKIHWNLIIESHQLRRFVEVL